MSRWHADKQLSRKLWLAEFRDSGLITSAERTFHGDYIHVPAWAARVAALLWRALNTSDTEVSPEHAGRCASLLRALADDAALLDSWITLLELLPDDEGEPALVAWLDAMVPR